MASLKQIHKCKGVASTTDAVTWTTISSYTLSTNCAVQLESWLVGKDSSGRVASATAVQALERISGTSSLIGSIVPLLTFTAGSNALLTTAAQRFNISGSTIQLQVTGVAATTIEWMGGFEIRIN